ncbi:MAG TPA: hypothetical protein DCS19_10090 [Flavobacterium sp.]|nr:hypothetical protein [Flavobacterium sp.]
MKTDFNPKQKSINAIRKLWKNSPMRKLAMDLACLNSHEAVKKRKYRCEKCKQNFYAQHIEIDHLEASSHDSIDVFLRKQMCGVVKIKKSMNPLEKLVCEMYNGETLLLEDVVKTHLQVLCLDCHKEKTNQDKALLREVKKKGKKV